MDYVQELQESEWVTLESTSLKDPRQNNWQKEPEQSAALEVWTSRWGKGNENTCWDEEIDLHQMANQCRSWKTNSKFHHKDL